MGLRSLFFAAFSALAMPVFGIDIGQLPASGYLDTEVTAHYPLDQPENVDNLDFSLVFNGTASNNVEVAFGKDSDGDGKLSMDETDMVVGWDCGSYFAENFKTCEVVKELNVGAEGCIRSLAWHYRTYGNRAALKTFVATNELGVAFAALSAAKPEWLYDGNWNQMRLTARGVDAQRESFAVDVRRKGIVISFK
jgi:hypothetical protein